jgi:TRAP-type uncharacterized transport system substrate-binding protein
MRLMAGMLWRGRRLPFGGLAACGRTLVQAGVVGSLAGMLAAAPALGQAPQPAPPPQPAAAPQRAPAAAPHPPPALTPQQLQRARLNQDTLIIAAGRPGSTYLAMADDLGAAVGAVGKLRVLPVAGAGGSSTLEDALYLRGVDMAIVPANVLAQAKASKAFGGGLAQRLAYVTLLYSEELHVVAGAAVAAIGDLRGKRVAVPADDGPAQFTAGDIFERLGIAVDKVPMAPAKALEEVRAGTVAAAVLIGGKPLADVSALPKDGSMRLLSLSYPVSTDDAYAPAVLLPDDYPALIPPGAIVETVAVSAVLVANRGGSPPRRVARHTPALLDAIARLAISDRNPKWRDVNLGATLPGWTRVHAAEAWLKRVSAQRKAALRGAADAAPHPSPPPHGDGRTKPSEVAAYRRKKLIEAFDTWARKSAASGETAAK